MDLIDAHHHLWCPVTEKPNLGYTWLKNIGAMKPFGDPTEIQRDYLIEEFHEESKTHQLLGSVHVQCDGGIPDPAAETKWIDELNNKSSIPMVSVGFVNLADKKAGEVLERHIKFSTFRGIRQIIARLDSRPDLSFCTEDYLKNKTWINNYKLLAQLSEGSNHNLTFDCQLYPEQMLSVTDFLVKHDKTKVVIDHLGSPYHQNLKGFKLWEKGMEALASLAHTTVKLSGWGMYDKDWNAASIKDYYEVLYALFGANRMMYGSNYPVDKLMKTYDDILIELLKLTSGLDEEERKYMFHDTAKEFYQFYEIQ